MGIVGEVFGMSEHQIARVETEEYGDYLICRVFVNNNEVIKFPLAADADSNEVALRVGNIVDQTGLVDNPCRVTARVEP